MFVGKTSLAYGNVFGCQIAKIYIYVIFLLCCVCISSTLCELNRGIKRAKINTHIKIKLLITMFALGIRLVTEYSSTCNCDPWTFYDDDA